MAVFSLKSRRENVQGYLSLHYLVIGMEGNLSLSLGE